MAMMNVSIDLDINEWAQNSDPDSFTSLEQAVIEKLASQSLAWLTVAMQAEIRSEVENQAKSLMPEAIHEIIQEKLYQLMNEEFSLKESYGSKPSFVGTMEDYIKRTIDSYIKKPAGSDGRPLLDSCRDGEPAMMVIVKKTVKDNFSKIQEDIARTVKAEIDRNIEEVKREAIIQALSACGFAPK